LEQENEKGAAYHAEEEDSDYSIILRPPSEIFSPQEVVVLRLEAEGFVVLDVRELKIASGLRDGVVQGQNNGRGKRAVEMPDKSRDHHWPL